MNKDVLKHNLKRFIYESFRLRKKEDYAYLFSNYKREKNEVPWFYLRVFFVGLVVTISILFLFDRMFIGNDYYAMAIGCAFFALSYLSLIYELIRLRSLSISKILFITFLSSVIVTFVCIVIGTFLTFDFPNKGAVVAGIGEELEKGIFAIIVFAILRRNNLKRGNCDLQPIHALLVGASVGCGFAIEENFDYVFGFTASNFDIVDTILERGANCICTHIFWTALFTYAFYHFKKPLKNIKFYLVALGIIAFHIFWDLEPFSFIDETLFIWIQNSICICSYFVSFYILFKVIKKENNFKEKGPDKVSYSKDNFNLSIPSIMRLIASITLFVLLTLTVQVMYLDDNQKLYHYEVVAHEEISTYEEFVSFIQNGEVLHYDFNRPYDETMVDESDYYVKGVLVRANQMVVDGEYDVVYTYNLNQETKELKVDTIAYKKGEEYLANVDYLYCVDDDTNESYTYVQLIDFKTYNLEINQGIVYREIRDKVYYPLYYVCLGIGTIILLIGFSGVIIYFIKYKKNQKQLIEKRKEILATMDVAKIAKERGRLNIYIYGDSNSWGYIPSLNLYTGNDATQPRYDEKDMWWYPLKENHFVLVDGNNGRTTGTDHLAFPGKNALKTIDDDLAKVDVKMNLCIIMLGTNDFKVRYNTNAEEIIENLKVLIKKMRSKWTTKILVVAPPRVYQGNPITDAQYKDAEKTMEDYAKKLEKFALETGYLYASLIPCEIGVDGEHLTKEGHKKASEIISKIVNSL